MTGVIRVPDDAATTLQWLTLAVFAALALLCVFVLARRPALAAMATAVLAVAINHVAYYVAFLVFPEWLSALPTMLWSVVLRLHVAGTAAMALWAAMRQRHDTH